MMPTTDVKSHGAQHSHQPPPAPTHSQSGHPLPRRTSPANSVTLRHHRLAHDASMRASPTSLQPHNSDSKSSSNRRNSSGDSHDTGQSDPKKWFDQSNQNPTATFGNAMDIDPPFFQKESDSSNEDGKPYNFHPPSMQPKLLRTHSSSADDYRSVIDDLTVEIQKLKDELKRYKQKGPDMLRKEKLFEIKIHGLPKRKKRELETTLRDFAASLDGSPDASSSQRKKSSRHPNRENMYSNSGSMSKHASSSSGSNARPVDSAYASMSTGANSSGASLGRPSMSSRARSSEQKVESYLRDIPEGLYPRHMILTDKEKKKLVVRRLEQLFTGRISGKHAKRNQIPGTSTLAPAMGEALTKPQNQPQQQTMLHQPPTLGGSEPSREARILPPDQQNGQSGKKSRSRDNGSASNSHGDQTESGGNGNSSGSGTNTSPPTNPPPEQRPTRPKDLDPDRVQVPSENMDYIKHLGLVPPELLAESSRGSTNDVHADADGWVYLNLLSNLAQLHMVNVTLDFVRSAVSEISTKFQLSPDGRKIRWRGGSEGTFFRSDSSGENSQHSPETDDTDASNKEDRRKRQKTGQSTGDDFQSGASSSKNPSKFGPQISGSTESFHYKPLFVRQDSSKGEMSPDDTLSSFGPVEDSNVEDSRWGLSGSGGTGSRRKRRHDGAIIYYSGAPFCTDLSGDPGDVSPATYMMSSGQEQPYEPSEFVRPRPRRSASGSSIYHKPLSEQKLFGDHGTKMDLDNQETPELIHDSEYDSSDIGLDFPWTNEQQYMDVHPLEPCGLGGVLPDDHFMVVVSTKRPIKEPETARGRDPRSKSEEATDGIINRLATMSTSSPIPLLPSTSSRSSSPSVEIEYVSGRIKRLAPVPLPPPAIFFPPFSADSSTCEDEGFESEDDQGLDSSSEFVSRRANPHQSDDYPDGVDLSSGDEDGEDPDDEADEEWAFDRQNEDIARNLPPGRQPRRRISSGSVAAAAGTARGRSKSASADMLQADGSSAGTADGVASDSNSDSGAMSS